MEEIKAKEDEKNKHSTQSGFSHMGKANIWNYLVLSATKYKVCFHSYDYFLVTYHTKEK